VEFGTGICTEVNVPNGRLNDSRTEISNNSNNNTPYLLVCVLVRENERKRIIFARKTNQNLEM